MKKIQNLFFIIIFIALSSSSFGEGKGQITPYLDGTIQAGNNRNFGQIKGFIPLIQLCCINQK